MTIGEKLIEVIKAIMDNEDYSTFPLAWLLESMLIPILWDMSAYLENDKTRISIDGQTQERSGDFIQDAIKLLSGSDLTGHIRETATIERFIRAVLSAEADESDMDNMWYDSAYICDVWNSLIWQNRRSDEKHAW